MKIRSAFLVASLPMLPFCAVACASTPAHERPAMAKSGEAGVPTDDRAVVSYFIMQLAAASSAAARVCGDVVLVGPGLWRELKGADPGLRAVGRLAIAVIPGPDGGHVEREMHLFLSDDGIPELVASTPLRDLGAQTVRGRISDASADERRIVSLMTPSMMPRETPVVIVTTNEWRLAFAVMDHKIFWFEDLLLWRLKKKEG